MSAPARTKHADDRIVWAPPAVRGTVGKRYFPYLIHRCSKVALVRETTRETLDPMAIDRCRYCGGPMP